MKKVVISKTKLAGTSKIVGTFYIIENEEVFYSEIEKKAKGSTRILVLNKVTESQLEDLKNNKMISLGPIGNGGTNGLSHVWEIKGEKQRVMPNHNNCQNVTKKWKNSLFITDSQFGESSAFFIA